MSSEIWRRRIWLWLPPLVLILAAAFALLFYRLNYAGESAGLERRLAQKEQELARVTVERELLDGQVERAMTNRHQVEALYTDRFATRRQRLTQVTEEVKRLAKQAGLRPRAIDYPEEEIEDFQLVERSFDFTVEGRYQELRTFINLLELSPSFLILKEVAVTPTTEPARPLRISLALATLFSQESGADASPLPPAREEVGG